MAISVQSIFNATADLYRLKLIAGKEGLVRPVSWMYYTEDISTIDFIRGGELVVTTGMTIERQIDNSGHQSPAFVLEYLSRLINGLNEQQACGLIINIGKYIKEIPEEILSLCERLQFPLFTMPWEIHIIDIMQDYGNRIVNDQQKGANLEKTLYNAMFNQSEFNILQLENTSFANTKTFSVALMEIPENLIEKDEETFFKYMDYSFNIKTGLQPNDYCMFLHEQKIIYVFQDEDFESARKIEKIARKDKFFYGSKISVSGICAHARDLSAEYRHAELALKLCSDETKFCEYEGLGIFQLLGEVQDKRILERIYQQALGKLNVFGKDKLDDYLNTLRLYLISSGKVQKTAEENSTHRNTVNYRIRKICDVLDIDLTDGETRYMIQTALYIREMMEKM